MNPSSPDLEAPIKTAPNIEQQLGLFFDIEQADEKELRALAADRRIDFDAVRQKAAKHYNGEVLRKPVVAVLRDWLERERPARASRRTAGTDEQRQAALREIGEAWNPEAARG